MKKILLIILVLAAIPVILVLISLILSYINKNGPNVTDDSLNPTGTSEIITTSLTAEELPLPADEDIIRTYFNLINNKNISQAINMMSTKLLGEEPVQANAVIQEYGVIFNSWESVTVSSIKAIEKSSWPEDEHTYIVNIEINIEDNPPFQIWEEGTNTRFITLVNESGSWKIGALATGY